MTTVVKDKQKKINKLILPIAILALSFVLLILIIVGKFVGGGLKTFAGIFTGIFGMSFYGVLLFAITASTLYLFGKRVTMKTKYIINFALMFALVVIIAHMLSAIYLRQGSTFESYLKNCFNYFEYPTFGGVLAGVLVYPIVNAIGELGGSILFFLLLAITIFIATDYFYSLSRDNKFELKDKSEVSPTYENNTVDAPETQNTDPMELLYGKSAIPSPDKTQRESAMYNKLQQNDDYLGIGFTEQKNTFSTAPTSTLNNADFGSNNSDRPQILRYDETNNEKSINVGSVVTQNDIDERKKQVKADYLAVKAHKFDTTTPIIDGDEKSAKLKANNILQQNATPTMPNSIDKLLDGFLPDINDNIEDTFNESNDELPFVDNVTPMSNNISETVTTDKYPTTTKQEVLNEETNYQSLLKKQQPINTFTNNNIDINDNDNTLSQNKEHTITFTEKPIKSNFEGRAAQITLEVDAEEKKPTHIYKRYNSPPIDLLDDVPMDRNNVGEDYEMKSRILEDTLQQFKIDAKVVNYVSGPTVTRYELEMGYGITVKKVLAVTNDIAMRLASNGAVRIEAPIPGKNLFGVEVPNEKPSKVTLRNIVESSDFKYAKGEAVFAVGIDIGGKRIVANLADMPHLLIGGSTGTGKSVCLNSLIISLMYRYSPEELRFILIDPKKVEFSAYEGCPHLMLKNVICEIDKALQAFNWLVDEMERRFILLRETGVKNIDEYNSIIDTTTTQKMQRIVLIVDEFAELMSQNKQDVLTLISRLAGKARASGINLVLATQRPSVDVINGVIKNNLPARIALKVFSINDSRTIFDQGGPEKLLGKGDMLFMNSGFPQPVRIQGALVTNNEISRVLEYLKRTNESYFDDSISDKIMKEKNEEVKLDDNGNELDPLFYDALRYLIERNSASTSTLQQRFRIGYNRAGKIMNDLSEMHFISDFNGQKSRTILITMDEFEQMLKDKGIND